MTIEKKGKNKSVAPAKESKAHSLWRKPIILDAAADGDDPLATLYQGREADEKIIDFSENTQKIEDEIVPAFPKTSKKSEKHDKPEAAKEAVSRHSNKSLETTKIELDNRENLMETAAMGKIGESELKNTLKIKSETFHFTDIREILRGKSIDIYAYLRFLCGDERTCKIKHLDLMKRLDISRPTLFKQGEWLTRLSLIEKRSVPGDHLGTSYTVRRLEDVLPVSDALVKQLDSHIENFRQNVK